MSEALLQNAWRLHQAGKLPEAARLYADVLRANPRNFDALYQLAMIYLASRKFADAERLFATAVQINSQSPDLFYNRGCALQGLGRNTDALAAFAHALAMKPDFTQARNNRGVTLLALKRYREALICFDRVAAEKPGIAMVQNNRAMALLDLQEFEQTLAATGLALEIDPDNAEALCHRGAALTALGRHGDALADFDKALSIKPDYVEAHIHRGIVLAVLGRHEEAVASYSKALALRPGDIDILYNRGTSLWALRHFEETILDCEQVLKSDPHFKYARGNLLHSKLQCCDWRGLEDEKAMIASGLKAGLRVLRPLQNVAISEAGDALLQSSRIWAAHECPPSEKPLWRGERYHHDRIRIAYVSADFRLHPAAVQSAGVFEHHDRSRFETIAISLGADDGLGMRERMQKSFERFIGELSGLPRHDGCALYGLHPGRQNRDSGIASVGLCRKNRLFARYLHAKRPNERDSAAHPYTSGSWPAGHQFRLLHLQQSLQDHARDVCPLDAAARQTREQRAVVVASEPRSHSQSQARGGSPRSLRRTDPVRAVRSRP